MFDNIRIETQRLILRNFRLSDVEAFQAILAKDEVMHFLPESVMTIGEVRKIVDWYQDTYVKNTPEKILKWTLAVCLKPSNEIIGWSGVGPLEFDETQTELFYGIDAAYWSHGYATEASRAVLDYAFNTIGLKRIVAVVNPDNIASVRVAQKLGMQFEKTLTGLGEKFQNDEGSGLYSLTGQV